MSDRICALLLTFASAAGCGYAPARYADRPPVREAGDDRAAEVPAVRLALDELYHAEAYLDASLVDGLEVALPARAEDVNSLDEVVRSSWFRGGPIDLSGFVRDGPPVAPWLPVREPRGALAPEAQRIEDARGLQYQVFLAAADRSSAITASLPVASRLAHALGYFSAETHVVDTPGGQPAVAVRWPVGIDLGPTPMLWTRPDDPNDEVSHVARRSLRATWVLAAWLGIGRFEESTFRDVYTGEPGRGHVQHWLVGLGGALGAARRIDDHDEALDPSRDDVGFWGRLGSLGLSPRPPPPATEPTAPGLGIFPRRLEDPFDVRPPFAPHRRLRPDDAYWLVRRTLGVDAAVLRDAVGASGLRGEGAARLIDILEARRRQLARRVCAEVTPVDLVRLVGRRLTLLDREVAAGITRPGRRGYRALRVDASGARWSAPPIAIEGATIRLDLPATGPAYEVIRLWRLDGGRARPRAFEIHLVRAPDPVLRGLRH